jgi:hypothetical protein
MLVVMATMFSVMFMGVGLEIARTSMFVRMEVRMFMTMSVLRTVGMLMGMLMFMFVSGLRSLRLSGRSR